MNRALKADTSSPTLQDNLDQHVEVTDSRLQVMIILVMYLLSIMQPYPQSVVLVITDPLNTTSTIYTG